MSAFFAVAYSWVSLVLLLMLMSEILRLFEGMFVHCETLAIIKYQEIDYRNYLNYLSTGFQDFCQFHDTHTHTERERERDIYIYTYKQYFRKVRTQWCTSRRGKHSHQITFVLKKLSTLSSIFTPRPAWKFPAPRSPFTGRAYVMTQIYVPWAKKIATVISWVPTSIAEARISINIQGKPDISRHSP